MTTTSDSATSAEQGLTIERVFNAPRDLVWQAFTDPEQFKRWYGPASMTAHVCEIDLQVGGSHLFGLGAGDGVDYWTTGVYQESVATSASTLPSANEMSPLAVSTSRASPASSTSTRPSTTRPTSTAPVARRVPALRA